MLLLQASTTVMGNEVLDTLSASAISVAIIQWLEEHETDSIHGPAHFRYQPGRGVGHGFYRRYRDSLQLRPRYWDIDPHRVDRGYDLAYRWGYNQVLRFTVARVPRGETGISAHGSCPGSPGSADTGISSGGTGGTGTGAEVGAR